MNKLIATPLIAIIGVAGFGTVSHASMFTIDSEGDGYSEGWGLDRWEDGTADVVAYDSDLDGTLDLYGFDQNNDGVVDAVANDPDQNGILNRFAFDVDFNGQFDVWVTDANENGVPDSQDVGQVSDDPYADGYAIIGPPTNPGSFYNFMNMMAAMTGEATFGTPDSDHDGYNDNIDFYPSDQYRH